MGAGIFLSWSAADGAALDVLKGQLAGLGFPIWEYRDGQVIGQATHQTVLDAIVNSLATVACFSDATATRPWLQDEVAWAYSAYGGDQRRILPVWIGEHPQNLRPDLLRRLQATVGDARDDAGRRQLIDALTQFLRMPVPLQVPAAAFVLPRARRQQLFEDLLNGRVERTPDFISLCETLGMRNWPELVEDWTRRYGADGNDFTPFAGDRSLIAIVQESVDRANVERRKVSSRPIFLRWLHDDLSGANGDEAQQEARDRWNGTPLLLIDSVSTLDDKFRNLIDSLPSAEPAILWIPPYSLHTNALEDLLRRTALKLVRVSDAFRSWKKQESDPALAFDAPTSLSVQLWLQRTLVQLQDRQAPVPATVAGVEEGVQQQYGGRTPPPKTPLTGLPPNTHWAFGGNPRR